MALCPEDLMRAQRPLGTYHHGLVSTPPACANCPLRKRRKVMPDGPVPARIAVVGDAPAAREEALGRSFVGPSGEVLWEMLGPACGLKREETWVTNAALCRITPVRLDNGAYLPEDVVRSLATEACRQRLLDELRVIDPLVIIPMSDNALQTLNGVKGASPYAYRGSIIQVGLQSL